jgi:pimeloyl-ACP methyl ester carboxylesterase
VDFVEVDGLRIAYRRAGIGPALVMLHGAPSDSRTWQWMFPDLARDHTVVAWDAPGFGESSDIDDSWRAPEFADALAAFVAALGLERPHLVGRSMLRSRHRNSSCFRRSVTRVCSRTPRRVRRRSASSTTP